MILTHMVFFQFLGGASKATAPILVPDMIFVEPAANLVFVEAVANLVFIVR